MKSPSFFLIQSFLAFCASRNIVEAALKRGLSQPAMTAHLNQFNQSFEHDVFVMRGRKKELSLFGQKLYNYFNAKFGSLDEDLKQIQFEFLRPTQAQIKIGARSEILNYYSDRLEFPGCIHFEDIDGAKAVESVINKTLDLAISNHLEKAQDLIYKKAFTDQFVVLCPKKYLKSLGSGERLNQHISLDSHILSDLLNKPFISYKSAEHPFLNQVLNYFDLQKNSKHHRIISNWLTTIKMIQKGDGWSIVPQLYSQNLVNVISFDLKKIVNTETHFYFLYRKELRKIQWFQDFIESLKI